MTMLRVHSRDLHDHIVQEAGESLVSGVYTDLGLRCSGGQVLHCHKLVMSAVSPYLKQVIWRPINWLSNKPITLHCWKLELLIEGIKPYQYLKQISYFLLFQGAIKYSGPRCDIARHA